MFTRKSILGLATFAALGTAALAPTSASAWGHGGGHFGGGHFGGHFGGHWGGGHFGGGHWGGGHWGGWGGGHWGGWGHRFGSGGWGYRHYGYDRPFEYRHWWTRPYYGAVGAPTYGAYSGPGYPANPYPVSAPASAASGPPPAGPGCLVKGYLPDGSVVFTDRCTQESAVAERDDGTPPPQPGPPGPQRPR